MLKNLLIQFFFFRPSTSSTPGFHPFSTFFQMREKFLLVFFQEIFFSSNLSRDFWLSQLNQCSVKKEIALFVLFRVKQVGFTDAKS